MVRYKVIINGKRRLSAVVDSLLTSIQLHFGSEALDVFVTQKPNDAIQAAKESTDRNEIIICIGGDGTLNEVVNGIMMALAKPSPLLIIPNGTGNDFCRGQKFLLHEKNIISALQNLSPTYYDVVRICSESEERYCINVCDAGLGGYTTQILNSLRRMGIDQGFSYKIASLYALLKFEPISMTLKLDEEVHSETKFMMVTVCNGNTFGNGLIIHPDANPKDGKLHLVLFEKVTWMDYIFQLSNLKQGRKLQHPGVKYVECTSVNIQSSKNLPFELDGELMDGMNFDIELLPSILPILQY